MAEKYPNMMIKKRELNCVNNQNNSTFTSSYFQLLTQQNHHHDMLILNLKINF